MSDTETNETIAELIGWICVDKDPMHGKLWWTAPKAFIPVMHVPSFVTSLDAMRTALDTLTLDECNQYKGALLDVVFAEVETRRGILFATARQQAAAFLKTKGRK